MIRKLVPEVRFWACFAVIFALVSQALFPVQALALSMGHSTPVMCNDDTLESATARTDKSDVMGLKCADCVLASITGIQTPPIASEPAIYTVTYADLEPDIGRSPVKARAPPRPHSCGPPCQNQA
ncbi:hypothetical protein ABI_35690 [Asticcacaulis biprosthecium C19]|uniref:DUF2946 domain-containing protein n=1 Tax=Asticcacaulis biprosthecium C19 TaxID=715226 RepID=F4QQQ8_9CAUL|nr:hypothetical protein ABI_35690 [Asticcacaulis biprosthecium C19]